MSKSHIALIIAVFFFFTALSFYYSRTYGLPQFHNSTAVVPTVQPTVTMFPSPTPTASPSPTPTLIPTAVPTRKPTLAPAVNTSPASGVVNIMPLGDSITAGEMVPGGYRTKLWKMLHEQGYKVNMVGWQSNGTIELGDHDHEGHSGWTISQLSSGVSGWVTSQQPNIVLLHIGTNDVLNNASSGTMTQDLSALIGKIFAAKPDTYVVVAKLIPIPRGTGSNWAEYNAAIPGVVAQYSGQGRKIITVDMSNALTAEHYYDGVHPSYTGHAIMAGYWFPVVKTIYKEYLP